MRAGRTEMSYFFVPRDGTSSKGHYIFHTADHFTREEFRFRFSRKPIRAENAKRPISVELGLFFAGELS